jgi:hypothetical protein
VVFATHLKLIGPEITLQKLAELTPGECRYPEDGRSETDLPFPFCRGCPSVRVGDDPDPNLARRHFER